ncbi:Formate-dependent nitrite reductase complex subunit NrfG [BD1-7 clade bacterium]|uniref:Formate-dependent nitrite reductase complex subunit NrfG n=1 Tax=BD1-7 clade bacterium TaxID=2029982 RepID=A0A5S9NTR6_9GAMM|nr:Formate-dependent nitrite reductase complex subunit NrfG [BD1-7 clade bacterium]CAA0093908.1 Formate-dependent nitrite reductase complex subunit NrfG [BD1-7 clade bacterium]
MLPAFGLTLIAMVVIYFALMRKSTVQDDHSDRIKRNVRLYADRIKEIDSDLQDEYIDKDDFQRQHAELSRQLIDTVEQLENAPVTTAARRPWLLWFVPLPLAAFVIYGAIGAYPDWQISQQLEGLNTAGSPEAFQARMGELDKAMRERLEQKPDQLEYRLMVARFAMNKGDYDEAVSHYRILAELLPDDPDAQAFYAQAEYLRAGRKITADVAKHLDKALKLNPYQATALGLVGIHAFESGDLNAAVDAWQTLLQVLPPESDRAKLIRGGLEEARKRLADSGQSMASVQETGKADANAIQKIEVSVSVAANIPTLPPETLVFVYAKAASGPPMPLAARKLTLAQLPATIELDESMAMMPSMTLSLFKDVIVGARVSRSGQPIPQAGDWQGESQPFDWRKNGDVSVTIDQQVP